jgi:hypothetical protein
MPVFTNAKDLERHLKKALDSLQAEVITSTQAALGSKAISPKDTGRLLSSWFAAEGSPSREVAPEGTDSPNTDATSLRVDSSKQYFLSNSLPYAQTICLEGKATSKAANWFIDFLNVLVPRLQEKAAKAAKANFDL